VDYDQTLRRTLESITFAYILEPKINTSINIKFKAECINWSVYWYKDIMLSYTTIKFPLPNTWHSVNFYIALTHKDSFLPQCNPTFQILTLHNINSQLPTFTKFKNWQKVWKNMMVQYIILLDNSTTFIICINRITVIKVIISSLWYPLSKTIVEHQKNKAIDQLTYALFSASLVIRYYVLITLCKKVLCLTEVTNTAVICYQLRSPLL